MTSPTDRRAAFLLTFTTPTHLAAFRWWGLAHDLDDAQSLARLHLSRSFQSFNAGRATMLACEVTASRPDGPRVQHCEGWTYIDGHGMERAQ